MGAEIYVPRLLAQNLGADDVRLYLRHQSFCVLMRVGNEEQLADDEPENRIAQKLERFVVLDHPLRILMRIRAMCKGSQDYFAVLKCVGDLLFKLFEHKG